MQRRSVSIAAVAFAALAAYPLDSSAESRLLQDARRNAWAFLAERTTWAGEQPPLPRPASFDGVAIAELSWVRTSELRPGGSVQLDLAPGMALWADWDRYRPKAVQMRDRIDTLLLGLQFTFP